MPRNATGWWANTTMAARNAAWMPMTLAGTRGAASLSGGTSRRCRRMSAVARVAFATTASAAFQPKVFAMNNVSQFQVAATISTGGAANEVKVPPMETFTNRAPSARYFGRSGTSLRNTCGASISAAMVMAAGSVTKEPARGTAASHNQTRAVGASPGRRPAIQSTDDETPC